MFCMSGRQLCQVLGYAAAYACGCIEEVNAVLQREAATASSTKQTPSQSSSLCFFQRIHLALLAARRQRIVQATQVPLSHPLEPSSAEDMVTQHAWSLTYVQGETVRHGLRCCPCRLCVDMTSISYFVRLWMALGWRERLSSRLKCILVQSL